MQYYRICVYVSTNVTDLHEISYSRHAIRSHFKSTRDNIFECEELEAVSSKTIPCRLSSTVCSP